MIRFNKAFAAAALLFVMPTVASALGIQLVNVSSTGASPTLLQHGDQITFDLRLENSTHTEISSLEVLVSGFDTPGATAFVSSGLSLVSGGFVTPRAFRDDFGSGPEGGLFNLRSAPTTRWQINLLNPEEVRTSLFLAADTVPSSGDGSLDIGLGGTPVGLDGVHFRVTYQLNANAIGPAFQNLLLNFGTNAQYGAVAVGPAGETLAFQNASYALSIIPEPGTALLMGLGLAALAARRR